MNGKLFLTPDDRRAFNELAARLELDEKETARRLITAAVRAFSAEAVIEWPLRLQQTRD